VDNLDLLELKANYANENVHRLAQYLRERDFDVTGVTEADLDVDAEIKLGTGNVCVQVCVDGGACIVSNFDGKFKFGRLLWTFGEVAQEI
jgi:hypothetical protein